MAKTIEVLAGKGVLWHGRKKIRAGEKIPADLNADARKSLRAKGRIVDEVVTTDTDKEISAAMGEEIKAQKLDEAVTAARVAEVAAKRLDIKELTKAVQTAMGVSDEAKRVVGARTDRLTKAVQTAKGLRTKAQNVYDADSDNGVLATKVDEAEEALTTAEAALTNAATAEEGKALATKAGEANAAVVTAETELTDAHAAHETAVRLRVEADKLANDQSA